MKAVGNFDNDKEIGLWKIYYSNGQLHYIGEFENGKGSGEWKWYNESGQLLNISNYRKGERVGEWKWYNPKNGQLIRLINYETKERTNYDEQGNPTITIDVNNFEEDKNELIDSQITK